MPSDPGVKSGVRGCWDILVASRKYSFTPRNRGSHNQSCWAGGGAGTSRLVGTMQNGQKHGRRALKGCVLLCRRLAPAQQWCRDSQPASLQAGLTWGRWAVPSRLTGSRALGWNSSSFLPVDLEAGSEAGTTFLAVQSWLWGGLVREP